jgi:hypothetical protein
VLTARSRKRTVGTPTNRLSSVVGILSPTSSPVPSHAYVVYFIDSSEAGPGRILGPSDPSVSASGPTSAFGGPFSNATTPAFIGRHSSNRGAITGGVIGGIAVISILVAALLFLRRRRHSLVSSPVFDGDIAFGPHMDQVSRSTSSQGTVSSYFLETPTSLLRPYVHIFILSSSSACVSSHDSLFSLTLSTGLPDYGL